MSAAEVMAPVDAVPADVAEAPVVDPPAVPVDEEEEEEEVLVFKARGKRVRPAAEAKSGDPADDESPRGPIDASQADSPPKSSDDEGLDEEDAGLPGKKKLKLRTKGAAEAAKAAGFERQHGDSELEEQEDDEQFYYDEDDEEAALEMRMRQTGTLSGDEEEPEDVESEESEESEMEDSEDDFDLEETFARDDARRAAKAAKAKKPTTPAPIPENETDEQKEVRMAKEKAELAAMQQIIMREASRRARLSGYHVAPDRDPFAYRKIFAHVAARVDALRLPMPPPEQTFEEAEMEQFDDEMMDGDLGEDELSDEEEYEFDDAPSDIKKQSAKTVELDFDADAMDDDDLDDDLDDLDGVAAVVAAVKAKKAAGTLDISDEDAAKELAAQKALEAEEARAAVEEEDDLSEEETHEMTKKERLRQLKRAKAFFKADAAAARKKKVGEAFEDEAEMSEDGGHTSDEEEVEVEEEAGEDGRVIKRRATKRADGLLDREELEEMVDYIDFDDAVDDDERRAAKRAAAHARFEEERDDEEIRKMKEALENGFRRKDANGGALDDGPDGWQRRRRAAGEDSEEEDLGIDIPDRAWEAVELSSDDDGEWAERAARRKAAAAAEAQRAAAGDSLPAHDGEDSQVPSARDVGFGSQDFRSMIDAGKQRRRARTRVGVDAAAAAMEQAASVSAPGRFPPAANQLPRANSLTASLERTTSTSFLGRGNGSKSNAGAAGAGLVRTASLGGGGASRSFVFGASGDSQSMWDKDAEERSEKPATVLREIGGDENARSDFGWAPREKMAAPAAKPASRLGTAGGSQSLFGMLQASQDWDEVLGKSDDLAQGVKAAKSVKLRAVQR